MQNAKLAEAASGEAKAAFKAGEFDVAASLFTRAVSLGGERPHELHANRSASLMAQKRYGPALEAADAAIASEPGYIKGHFRRALALEGLERWDEAVGAAEAALAVGRAPGSEPSEAAAKQLRTVIERCHEAAGGGAAGATAPPVAADERSAAAAALEATAAVEVAASEVASAADQAAADQAAKEAAAVAAAALVEEEAGWRERAREERERRDTEEKRGLAELNASLSQRQADLKQQAAARRREETAATAAAEPAARAARAARMAQAEAGPEFDEDGSAGSAGAAAQARARIEAWRVKTMPTRAELEPPRVPSDFTKRFVLIRKDAAALFEYVQLVPPEACHAIFAPEIAQEVLVAICGAIAAHAGRKELPWAAAWLGGLEAVGRFEMTCMMLDRKGKAELAEMFAKLDGLLDEDLAAGGEEGVAAGAAKDEEEEAARNSLAALRDRWL